MILSELDPILEQIRKRAQQDGADAEVLVTRANQFAVSMSKGEIDRFDTGLSLCAGVRVLKDGAEGYCSTEDLGTEALTQAYSEALSTASFMAKQKPLNRQELNMQNQNLDRAVTRAVAEFVPPELISDGVRGICDQVRENWGHATDISEKLVLAQRLEAASLDFDPRITSVPWNRYQETRAAVRIYNTKGVDGRYEQGSVSAYVAALAKRGDEARTGTEHFFSLSDNDFDPEGLGRLAAQKALARLGAQPPTTGLYPVLLMSLPASDLLAYLAEYLSGKAVAERRSIFCDDLAHAIASSKVSITDDPNLEGGLGSRPFDSEGFPSQTVPLIANGVLNSFLLNSVYARKLKMKNTGHAARGPRTELGISASNLIVWPGPESRTQLLRQFPKVIVIDHLSGFHSGFQEGSGNFSLPAEGYLYESGQLAGPLTNFVVSGNFKELLKSIVGVASERPRPVSSVVSPDLLISELSIVGREAVKN